MQSQRIRSGVANKQKIFNLQRNLSGVVLQSPLVCSVFAIELTETALRTNGDCSEILAKARRLRCESYQV